MPGSASDEGIVDTPEGAGGGVDDAVEPDAAAIEDEPAEDEGDDQDQSLEPAPDAEGAQGPQQPGGNLAVVADADPHGDGDRNGEGESEEQDEGKAEQGVRPTCARGKPGDRADDQDGRRQQLAAVEGPVGLGGDERGVFGVVEEHGNAAKKRGNDNRGKIIAGADRGWYRRRIVAVPLADLRSVGRGPGRA